MSYAACDSKPLEPGEPRAVLPLIVSVNSLYLQSHINEARGSFLSPVVVRESDGLLSVWHSLSLFPNVLRATSGTHGHFYTAGEARMPPPLEEQVAEILERLRFHSIHRVMVLLNLCWDDENVPPSLARLRHAAECLLRQACAAPGDFFRAEAGGFRVEKRDGVLELLFVVHGWDGR